MKPYITLKEYYDMLKAYSATIQTSLLIHTFKNAVFCNKDKSIFKFEDVEVIDDNIVIRPYKDEEWNCLILKESFVHRTIDDLIKDLHELVELKPNAAVLIDGISDYNIILRPCLKLVQPYDYTTKINETTLNPYDDTYDKAVDFVKLLNDLNVKTANLAKALATEKYNCEIINGDAQICYYKDKWFTLKQLHQEYEFDSIEDMHTYDHPIYVINKLRKSKKEDILNDNLSLDILNRHMVKAASVGDEKLLNSLLKAGANDYNTAMANAARNGHEKIVREMLKFGANDYNWAMAYAAAGGHENIMNLMIDLGANNYNQAMADAARSGHENIVRAMLKLGANDYNWTMTYAAAAGHEKIVKLMLEQGANDYDGVMVTAAYNGDESIVKLMLERGATNYELAIIRAKQSGYEKIVKLLKESQESKKCVTQKIDMPNDLTLKLKNSDSNKDKDLYIVKKKGDNYVIIGNIDTIVE